MLLWKLKTFFVCAMELLLLFKRDMEIFDSVAYLAIFHIVR